MSASTESTQAVRRRLPPDERRAQLLAIAIDVFAQRGLGAARHAEIAERAGVSISTVFNYFPTRDELVADVLHAVATFFLDLLEDAHSRERPCPDTLREINEAFLDLLTTHRSYVLVWLEWSSAVREEVWPAYRAFTERAVRLTLETLKRGQREGSVAPDADCESLARLFTSTSQSIARLRLGEVDLDTIHRFQETLMRAVLTDSARP